MTLGSCGLSRGDHVLHCHLDLLLRLYCHSLGRLDSDTSSPRDFGSEHYCLAPTTERAPLVGEELLERVVHVSRKLGLAKGRGQRWVSGRNVVNVRVDGNDVRLEIEMSITGIARNRVLSTYLVHAHEQDAVCDLATDSL